jgi:hypothetical protein
LLALGRRRTSGCTSPPREIEKLMLADPGFRNEEGRFDKRAFDKYTATSTAARRRS